MQQKFPTFYRFLKGTERKIPVNLVDMTVPAHRQIPVGKKTRQPLLYQIHYLLLDLFPHIIGYPGQGHHIDIDNIALSQFTPEAGGKGGTHIEKTVVLLV